MLARCRKAPPASRQTRGPLPPSEAGRDDGNADVASSRWPAGLLIFAARDAQGGCVQSSSQRGLSDGVQGAGRPGADRHPSGAVGAADGARRAGELAQQPCSCKKSPQTRDNASWPLLVEDVVEFGRAVRLAGDDATRRAEYVQGLVHPLPEDPFRPTVQRTGRNGTVQ